MVTHAQATAAPAEIRLGGKSYRMAPLSDVDIAEMDLWLQSRIMRMARASLPPDASQRDRDDTMRAATQVASTMTWISSAGAQMMGTPDGMARLAWQGLKTHHPELTPSQVREMLLDPANMEEAVETFGRLNEQPDEMRPAKKKRRAAMTKKTRKKKTRKKKTRRK